ncbi:MAG: encapsulin [Archaeoglobaceae archaeon]|nr:encapsulin [Archaeoglobaceae archaeon]MDW8117586.1 family 1 encapsulin nanocompartment shell protein [Archaeoglobaceae archaeon]
MLAINPTLVVREKPYNREELMEALRLAISAELDAISLYEQMARFSPDENCKKIFIDVAREEKTHVGEFTALLLSLDQEQVKELKDGFKEVEEKTGIKTALDGGEQGYLAVLTSAFLDGVTRSRKIFNFLPKTRISAQSYRIDFIGEDGEVKVVKQEFRAIPLITQKFLLGLRELSDGSFDPAVAVKAGEMLVKAEEKQMINAFLIGKRMKLGNWEKSDECIDEILKAMREVSKFSSGPFAMILSPERFSKLLKVHEMGGKMLIEILREIFGGGIIVTPSMEDRVIVFANNPSVLDIVIGQELEIKELGPEGDKISFIAMEALDLRIKNPNAVVVMEKWKE